VSKPKATDTTPETSNLASTGATHTWEDLVKAVSEPTAAQLDLYAVSTAPAALVERGSHIGSDKILTDMVRLCGTAAEFYPKATPAQRGLLLGFSTTLLSVAVYSGVKLRGMVGHRGSTVDDREATKAADATTAATTYEEGTAVRDRLNTALEVAIDGDPTLTSRLDSARGRVQDHPALTTSLLGLVKFGRGLLHDKSSRVGARLADGGLTEAQLDAVTALAAKVESTGAVATGARKQGPVSQAELDFQDGVCLAYLEKIMKVWNGAHEHDPAIPQLLPIATRPIFAPTRKRTAAAAAEPAAPAAVPAAPAAADPADPKKPA
jgi:hypothetical protein